MLQNLDAVFRLRSWAIYRRKGRYYITQEERINGNKGKAYKSLRLATTAIARKMELEWNDRLLKYGGDR